MRIYNINTTSFMAKRTNLLSHKAEKEMKFTKKNFYKQIDDFLKHKTDVEDYLKSFSKSINTIKQKDMLDYSIPERKYIDKLIATLELSENPSKMPRDLLEKDMKELLKEAQTAV